MYEALQVAYITGAFFMFLWCACDPWSRWYEAIMPAILWPLVPVLYIIRRLDK